MYTITKYLKPFYLVTLLLSISFSIQANTLDNISYTTLPGDQLQIRLTMSETPEVPGSFTIDNPARIAFDLAPAFFSGDVCSTGATILSVYVQ